MSTRLRARMLKALGYLTPDGQLTARGQDYAEERHYGTGLEDVAFEGTGTGHGLGEDPAGDVTA